MDSHDWSQRPLAAVIQHILDGFHAPLRKDLPRLNALARAAVDNSGSAPGLVRIHELLQVLSVELEAHMQKEEQVLFPMVLAGHGAEAMGPVGVLEADHQETLTVLAELRALAGGFAPPADPELGPLWQALQALETGVKAHIAIEDDVLHPRALAGEAAGQG